MLIEKIEKFYKSINNKSIDGIHASSLAKCPREIYYSIMLEKEKEFEPRVLRIFEMGDAFHQRMMRLLFRIPDIRIIASEIPIPKNELLKGTCDAIVSIDGENYVIDFKSINDYGFQMLTEPKKDHLIQLLIYLYFFRIEKGIILYENKDTQELKEFVINIAEHQDLLNQSLAKAQYLSNCIAQKILPEKTTEVWRCEYCAFKEECKKDLNVK
jgi:CRISPR/Cas system-associated exonuclease Cas4 (RecB family)